MRRNAGYEALPATQMLASACMYCGKPLEQPHSIERGVGDVCAQKYGVFTPTAHFDDAAVERALSSAPEALADAVRTELESGTPEDAMKRINHLTAYRWFRGADDAPLYMGSSIELARAMGFCTVADRLVGRYIEGAQKGDPGGGFVITAVGGTMWRLQLPYERNYQLWKRTTTGLFTAGARETREGKRRYYDFDQRDWVKVLNVLSDSYPGRLGILPDGETFVVPEERLPVPAPPGEEATGAPDRSTGESGVEPAELAVGMEVELNDGRVMVIGWMSHDRTSVGVVTPEVAAESLERKGRISPGRGGYNGNPDAAFVGTEQVKTARPSAAVKAEVERTVSETAEPEAPPRIIARDLPEGMFDYQREGAVWLDTQQSGILAFEQGLGKTLTSIAVADAPVVVVCPAKLRINWVREFTRWRPDLTVASVGVEQTEEGKIRKLPGKITDAALAASVVVINYDTLSKNLDRLIERGCRTLICDEAHLVKEMRIKFDKRTRRYHPSASAPKRAGAVWRLAQVANRRLLLTGTPIKNRPSELWALLHLVDPERWKSFHNYCLEYCDAYKGRFGWDYTGSSNEQQLNELISGRYMLRRKKDDVLDLPEKSRRSIQITVDEETAKEYSRAAAEFLAWVRRNGGPEAVMRAMRAEALVKMTALRRLAARGKIDHVTGEIVEHLDSTERPLVVMGWHVDALNALIAALETESARRTADGGRPIRIGRVMGGREAQADIDAFQHGVPEEAPEEERTYLDVLVCNIQAAGVGLTLTRAREMFFIERHWTPADLVQAEDRIHRIGQKNDVTITYYDAAGTIDEYLSELLLSKVKTVAQVIDGVDLPEEDAGTHVFGRLFNVAEGMSPNPGPELEPDAYDWGNPAV